MIRSLWNALASLRLTVACLAVSVVVIFIGTVAQADEGLYEAQARYFKQWLVWGPIFLGYRLPILLPGGYLLGTVLVVNLVAAHSRRFSWSVRKTGIHLTHLGIMVLLVGQLATDMLSVEKYLRLREGESKDYTEITRAHELVLVSDAGDDSEHQVIVPASRLAGGERLDHEEIPFSLRVKAYHANSDIFARDAVLEAAERIAAALAAVEGRFATVERLVDQAEADLGTGRRPGVWRAALAAVGEKDSHDIAESVRRLSADRQERLRRELKARFRKEMVASFVEQGGASGVVAERLQRDEPVTPEAFSPDADRGYGPRAVLVPLPKSRELNAVNIPSATVEAVYEGEGLGTWLLSPWLGPQEIAAGGSVWQAELRPARVEHPFEITLLETTHEVYLGTRIPRDFQSRIRIDHPARGETREVDISMNNPLRYEGLTFYQYQMGEEELDPDTTMSTLLVVRNPVRHAPYLGCILVAVGLSYQFLFHLGTFLARGRGAEAGVETAEGRGW